ncbi:hypothetical protein [Alicyclobacillus sp.]|uniref:hypothetical protein n=1 Tax=Alicyclobacillus sp. TaxID=61169 RepID=UPI0025C2F57A|nr:hypothetical protein [Alicyclobacillus sp.]MCL6516068.1 hypothetical protein [Alicyclobacillus sp.]
MLWRRLAQGATGLVGVLAAVWVGLQSYAIAAVGVGNAIPQLEGDGGAGMVFALLFLVGAVLIWVRPRWAWMPLLLAMVPGLLAGWLYQDVTMWGWCLVPALLAAASHGLHRWRRRNLRGLSERRPRGAHG